MTRSSVPVPAPAIETPGRPVPGSLFATPVRTTAGPGALDDAIRARVRGGGRVRGAEQDDLLGPGGRRGGQGRRPAPIGGEATRTAETGAERQIGAAVRRRSGRLRQHPRLAAGAR